MTSRLDPRQLMWSLAAPVAAVVISLLVGSVVLLIVGSNPIEAFGDLLQFNSTLEGVVDMLNRATALYLSAVAVAIGFRMNLFNIGVEGQYRMAGIIAAQAGAVVALPAPLHVAFIIVVAMMAGSAYAAIPGLLKVTRGIHEVISTIMLNAISVGFVVAYLLSRWDVPDPSYNTETEEIPTSGWMPSLNRIVEVFTRDIGKGRELYGFLLVAVAVGVVYHIYVNRTRPGYDLRISGWNPTAAQASGVNPNRMIMQAMMLSGAVAGLVALPEILGRDHAYGLQLTTQLGFNGIAVALLGLNHPVGMAAAALVFGFLDSTSTALDYEVAPPEIGTIMKGTVIFTAVIVYEVARRRREAEEARAAAAAMARQAETTGSGVAS